jgi:hypothetical protein
MAGGKAYNNDVTHIVEGKHITGRTRLLHQLPWEALIATGV